jgi:transposase
MRKAYQSELSDSECSCLESYLPAPEANGRPRLHSLREILHAIFFYVLKKSGCACRLLAHDFPPWKTLSTITFRLWRLDGSWERMHTALRKSACGYACRGTLRAQRCNSSRQSVAQDHRRRWVSNEATTAPRRSKAF